MKFSISNWIKFSLFNLMLVAILGTLMRYKIAFELPIFIQKNIQHSHSHFAFSGWVTQTLFVLMIHFLTKQKGSFNLEKYKIVLISNLVCAYIMLFSFIFQGYGVISIVFSTLSLFVSFWFSALYFYDLKQVSNHNLSKNWFKAALFFNVISSFGTFGLAYMMMSKNFEQDYYLSSIYYYLHFQYNGWFWFACVGLFMSQLTPNYTIEKYNMLIFKLFFISCFPAYLLSVLWLKLPVWVYLLGIISAVFQLIAWFIFTKKIIPTFQKNNSLAPLFKWIYTSIVICVTLKFLLQIGSTIPEIGQLAFGFRTIVIAYLHLVLLAIISGFLLVYIFTNQLVIQKKSINKALVIFIIGIFLNELVLAIQGFQGIEYFSTSTLPFANEILLIIALILFYGIFKITYLNMKKD